MPIVAIVLADQRPASGSAGAGSPRGTSPTSATPCAPRSNRYDASRPPDDQHERARDRRRDDAAGRGSPRARPTPTSTRRPVRCRRAMPSHERELAPRACRRRPTCRSASGSSPITTSIAAPARKPVITAFDRNCAIQPIRSSASSRNSTPVASAIAATSCAASSPREPGDDHRAAGDRRQRRARARRDLPGGAEERVDDARRRRRRTARSAAARRRSPRSRGSSARPAP